MAIDFELYQTIEAIVEKKVKDIKVDREEFNLLTNEVRKLAKAQNELAVAQKETEKRLTRVERAVEELAVAQKETEKRLTRVERAVEELAIKMEEGFKSLRDQIAALGSRWGIYAEGTFRATIKSIFSRQPGVKVKEGYYGGRQVDIIISGDEHILLEITSRMVLRDIKKIYDTADDYKQKEGIEPTLMVATAYISPSLMQKIMGLERKIEVFSYEEE
ncbi:MAG: DUF3782 domain-containing protein [bacterium]